MRHHKHDCQLTALPFENTVVFVTNIASGYIPPSLQHGIRIYGIAGECWESSSEYRNVERDSGHSNTYCGLESEVVGALVKSLAVFCAEEIGRASCRERV